MAATTRRRSVPMLARDGWAGYEPVDASRPAKVTTVPVTFVGNELRISADVSPSGSIRVAIVDPDKGQIALNNAITQTVSDTTLTWREAFPLNTLRGQHLQLRFETTKGRLYAFSFASNTD